MKKLTMVFMFLLLVSPTALAEVKVIVGPTPIPNGDATDPTDITVQNDLFAVSFNVATPGPWGAPLGGIMDGGVLRPDGKIDIDRLAWVDFLPDNWSEWVPTYHRVKVAKETPEEVVITAERDWQGLAVESSYTIKDGDDKVRLQTKFSNITDKEVSGIYSGFCLWNNGGYALPLAGTKEPETSGMVAAEGALVDWFVNYDETWATALHAPYTTYVNYRGKDMHQPVALKPGESLEFEGWLQMIPDGGLTGALDFEMERKNITPGLVKGKVATSSGNPVPTPVIVVKKDGQAYLWAQGKDAAYELRLPEGKYTLYASGKNFGPGKDVEVTVKSGEEQELDFKDVELPAIIDLTVADKNSKKPLDARIKIESGYTPEVRYLGQKIFFTDVEKIGQAPVALAAGDYELSVSHGGGYLNKPSTLKLKLKPAESIKEEVLIENKYQPSAKKWYAADIHHHSDILDGATAPEIVSLGQSARGMDLILLSDHDSAANHSRAAKVAEARKLPFIPAIEISPSWSHFNALGLPLGRDLANPNSLTVKEIFEDARKNGAQLMMVNHPFNNFGYYKALAENKAPGGYYDAYDLVEINGFYVKEHAAMVMERMYEKWNKGLKVYLGGGTDYHDLWAEDYADIRTVAFVNGELTPESYLAALKAGHAYISLGPIVYPQILFGEEGKAGEIGFTIESATPFKAARFIHNGKVLETRNFDPPAESADLKFKAPDKGWVSLELDGESSGLLWTNPIWIK